MGYTKTGDPFVCASVLRFLFIFDDADLVTSFRLAQYYLSPTKPMRKNMKAIIFRLDIRDMVCLELSHGMCLFIFSVPRVFPPLLSSRSYQFLFLFLFFFNIMSLKLY